MKRNFIVLFCLPVSLFAQTNVLDPSGNSFSTTSDFGFYWDGFYVGLAIFGFAWIVRLCRKGASDF